MFYVFYGLIIIMIIYLAVSMLLGYACFKEFLKVSNRRDYFDEAYLEKRYIKGNLPLMKEYNEHNNYIELNCEPKSR